MVRDGERCVGAVGILTHHGDVVAFPNNVEPEGLKRLDDARLGRVNLGTSTSDRDAGLSDEHFEDRGLGLEPFVSEGLDMKPDG